MKKPKININVEAIKQWFIDQGEKVALGVFGALLFVFLFGLVTTETYDETTKSLGDATAKAKQTLANPDSWKNAGEERNFQNQPYDEIAKDLAAPVDLNRYVWRDARGTDLPMFEPLKVGSGRSREPVFLAALDPVATAGRGGFEILEQDRDADRRSTSRPARGRDSTKNAARKKDDPNTDGEDRARAPSAKPEGFRWVTVRAVIPVGLQKAEYTDALNLQGPRAADPVYRDYVLERRQLTPEGEWSAWEEVDPRAIRQVLPRIQLGGVEVVSTSQTGVLTAPLPTRDGGGDWVAREIGHPKFKTRDPKEAAEEAKLAVEDEAAQPDAAEMGPFGIAPRQNRAAVATKKAAPVAQAAAARLAASRTNPAEELVLFRTFDFTAEPGQAYQYRVQLVLENPNYDRPLREVQPIPGAEQQPNEGRDRRTPWSVATTPVSVPEDVTYYVEEFVERGGGRQDVQVDLVRWDKDTGSFDSNMTTLTRGQVIRSKAKRDIALPDFIVDYTGGTRRLSRLPDSDEVLPTEVLAVNDAGELVVRTERADDDAHAIIQTRTSQPDRDATEDTTGINTFDFSGGLAKPSN